MPCGTNEAARLFSSLPLNYRHEIFTRDSNTFDPGISGNSPDHFRLHSKCSDPDAGRFTRNGESGFSGNVRAQRATGVHSRRRSIAFVFLRRSAARFYFCRRTGSEMRDGTVGNRDDLVASNLDSPQARRNELGPDRDQSGDENGSEDRSGARIHQCFEHLLQHSRELTPFRSWTVLPRTGGTARPCRRL